MRCTISTSSSSVYVFVCVSGCMQEPAPPAAVGVEQEEEEPMYFQDPRTLLQIYAQLEEQNLFLIQNAQESEEALEELRTKFRCLSAVRTLFKRAVRKLRIIKYPS